MYDRGERLVELEQRKVVDCEIGLGERGADGVGGLQVERRVVGPGDHAVGHDLAERRDARASGELGRHHDHRRARR